MLAHPEQLGGAAARFAGVLGGPDGADQEIDRSTFAIDITGRLYCVIIHDG